MAAEMALQKIVPEAFAGDVPVKMAGYRNRLTHFYFEVSSKEMHGVIQNGLVTSKYSLSTSKST